MPAPSPIDMKAPLTRRKALIQKLMSQMASVHPGQMGQGMALGTHASSPIVGFGRMAAAGREPGTNLVPFMTPAGIQPPAPPQAPPEQAPDTPPIGPVDLPPDPGAGQTPASAPALAPWQSAGAISAEAYESFQNLADNEQMRIMASPTARRRYFL